METTEVLTANKVGLNNEEQKRIFYPVMGRRLGGRRLGQLVLLTREVEFRPTGQLFRKDSGEEGHGSDLFTHVTNVLPECWVQRGLVTGLKPESPPGHRVKCVRERPNQGRQTIGYFRDKDR